MLRRRRVEDVRRLEDRLRALPTNERREKLAESYKMKMLWISTHQDLDQGTVQEGRTRSSEGLRDLDVSLVGCRELVHRLPSADLKVGINQSKTFRIRTREISTDLCKGKRREISLKTRRLRNLTSTYLAAVESMIDYHHPL